jgi:hypothetical protein
MPAVAPTASNEIEAIAEILDDEGQHIKGSPIKFKTKMLGLKQTLLSGSPWELIAFNSDGEDYFSRRKAGNQSCMTDNIFHDYSTWTSGSWSFSSGGDFPESWNASSLIVTSKEERWICESESFIVTHKADSDFSKGYRWRVKLDEQTGKELFYMEVDWEEQLFNVVVNDDGTLVFSATLYDADDISKTDPNPYTFKLRRKL